MPSIPNDFVWETVAVPLVSGVDLNTRARLVEKTKLLKAENIYFPRNGGPEIRRGHTAYTVKDSAVSQPAGGTSISPSDNLIGYGLFNSSSQVSASILSKSSYPDSGNILGLATRDDEVLSWDGHRLFTHHSHDGTFTLSQNSGAAVNSHAIMPYARTETIAKTAFSQNYSDLADNGVIRVVAFVDSNTTVNVFCYDSQSGSLRFKTNLGVNDAQYIKLVPVGAHIHIYVNDSALAELFLYTVHQDAFELSAAVSLGQCNVNFDIAKASESLVLVAKRSNTNTVLFTYVNAIGTINSTYFSANYVAPLAGVTCTNLSIAVHHYNNDICLFFNDTNNQYVTIYSQNGTSYGRVNVASLNDVKHLTCAPAYLTEPNGTVFYLWMDVVPAASNRYVNSYRARGNFVSGMSASLINTLYNVNLASKGFRVGNFGMVMACYPTTLQTQYLLLDQSLTLRGRLEYGTAVNNTTDPWLPTVNYLITDNRWDITDFHCALLNKIRVLTQNTSPPTVSAVFQEINTKFVQLSFSHKLVSAQFGRCTYFPGSLLWMYDGKDLIEANFIAGPEGFTMASSGAGGSMVPGNVYRYRIYLCHKNAQGEEVRSLAFLSNTTTVGGGHNRVTITGNTIPSTRTDAYFLVYRNENNGTLWYLVSDRDPASANCPKNNLAGATWTFDDTLADASILTRELDPGNNTSWLAPWAAPSCELVYSGKDRLWIAGGEIPPGEVWASRLAVNEIATFNPVLTVSVDKTKEQVQAIGFIANYVTVFKKNTVYLLTGEFSANVFSGNSISTQLALGEIGAVSPYLARINTGLLFQSAGGFRIIEAGGAVSNIGSEVDTLSGDLVGVVVSYTDRNVRFYQSDSPSCVLDYESGEWSTFTLQPTAAVIGSDGFARLAVGNKLYVETADLYTDDSRIYEATVKTAWLGAQIGGFIKVKRFGVIGEYYDHSTVTVNVYKDESEAWSERFSWDSEDDLNTSTWGGGNWGSGFWGDSTGTHFAARDSIWRFRRRLNHQRCSAVSIELVFSSRYGKAVVPTALILEIGNKNMMGKMPTRTFGV